MSKGLLLTVAALGLIWIVSLGALLFVIAGLSDTPALIIAIVCQVAVFAIGGAILLVTNTRSLVPPPAIPPHGIERRESPGRRATDVAADDVRRVISAVESIHRPPWAQSTMDRANLLDLEEPSE